MKHIFLNEEDKKSLLEDISRQLDNTGMFEGNLAINKVMPTIKGDGAYILYTPEAYAKMIRLMFAFDSEVAWHCLVRRTDEPGEFLIYDILVYDQVVTGVTVNTDDKGYYDFLVSLTDEEAEFMHGQCHSHVNMSTSPSSTDKNHQNEIVQAMGRKGFYVFQIWNKKLEHTSMIYDFDNNIYYEDKDIGVEVLDEMWGTVESFISEAMKHVKKRETVSKPTTPKYSGTYGWTGGSYYNTKQDKSYSADKNETQTSDKNKSKKKEEKTIEEDDEDYYAEKRRLIACMASGLEIEDYGLDDDDEIDYDDMIFNHGYVFPDYAAYYNEGE